MVNRYVGLENGALAHSAIENMISDGVIEMGAPVRLVTSVRSDEIQPRVVTSTGATDIIYGIAVGGEADGVYGDGSAATSDLTRATTGAGQSVRIITRGRAPAKVFTGTVITVGSKLVSAGLADGAFTKLPGATTRFVAAITQR